jgi:tRNA dimethylallyltransferase
MGQESAKSVIIICGPTAVGKTAVAIALAQKLKCSIISADSRQCYKELNIGVARPSKQELKQVPHYFIGSHSIQDEITAAGFEQYALDRTRLLHQSNNQVVMVGGTGLYIRAFCEGLDEIPEIDPDIRSGIIEKYEANGITWLQDQLKEKDPDFYEIGEMQNPQRMMRALEVVESTGQSILQFQKGTKASREFNILKIGLELPREELVNRINTRVDEMMKAGLLEEVRTLLPFKKLNALQTVGYSELFDHLQGLCTLENAVEQIKIHTRQYAKRQMTWFKRDTAISWFHPENLQGMEDRLSSQLTT